MSTKYTKKEIIYAGKPLILETGELANQANMAVKATYGETVVLTTVVSGEPKADTDFFPLTINYEEKMYASGYIKNSRFVKRDGRANDDAVVAKRLIDHAVRPLFPKDYMDEVQVVNTVLSLDETSDPEFLSMIATSAALFASDIPWTGPMVSLKIGYIHDNYVLNPAREEAETHSDLNMMVSFVGFEKKFLAIEAEANILPENKVLGAIEFAFGNLDPILNLIKDFAHEVNPGQVKYTYKSRKLSAELMADVEALVKDDVTKMMQKGFDKLKIKEEQKRLKDLLTEKLAEKYTKVELSRAFEDVEKHALQHLILEEKTRPDGREIKEIRQISSNVGLLPRAHGSALFSRGVTQVLTVATLGSPSNELFIQNMWGERTKRYIHYYNFPPFSVGETGKIGGGGSREIGHGMLAEKALKAVIPSQKDFPYMILLVSETLGSSGSSSMASACGSTLALMDAGVPIKDMVAGVGVGLIADEDEKEFLIMTDLAYMEDAFGFLDFKMTGTKDGVTAMQADMKLKGIPMSLLPKIFEQSREGRLFVLEEMKKTLTEPRKVVSKYAPKTLTIKIDPSKIGIVIGSGGKTIKEIQERTESELTIEEDGTVIITAKNEERAKVALSMVDGLTRDVQVGEVFEGVVKEIVDFGAFVEILPGKQGLLHVSEIANTYVSDVREFLKEEDKVQVKVLAVDRMSGKISLSKKALEAGYVEPTGDNGGGRPQRFDRGDRGDRGGSRGGPSHGGHGGPSHGGHSGPSRDNRRRSYDY